VSIVLMELGRIAAETRDFWLPPMLATPVVFARDGAFAATLTVIQIVNVAAIALRPRARFVRSRHVALRQGMAGRRRRSGRRGHVRVDTGACSAGRSCSAPPPRRGGHPRRALFRQHRLRRRHVFGLKVLFLAAAGGYDSPPRAALGAAAFGMAEALWSGYFLLEWRDAWIFAFLVALLVLRRGVADGRGQF
jgi:branched-chain amino acid transport system permease protein